MLALTCLLPTPVTAQDDIAEAIANGNSLPPALQYTRQNESQYTTLADITRHLNDDGDADVRPDATLSPPSPEIRSI
jgi:hypothetical protein